MQVDHIRPRYYGGGHEEDNLQILCRVCNTFKGTETIAFRTHTSPLPSPPVNFAILAFPANEQRNGTGWIHFLKRNVNFFYRCAAVQSVNIHNDHICHIVLHAGNDPAWVAADLRKELWEMVCRGKPTGVSSIRAICFSVAGADQAIDQMILLSTPTGAIRRIPLDSYRTAQAGDGTALCAAHLTDTALVITDQGNGYIRTVTQLPEGAPSSDPTLLHPYWHLVPNERIVATLSLPERAAHGYLVLLTHRGRIKRLPLEAIHAAGMERCQLITPDAGQSVGWAVSTAGNDDLILVTRWGYALRCAATDVPLMEGRMAGIPAMRLPTIDDIAGMGVAVSAAWLLCVTASGSVTLRSPDAIPLQRCGEEGRYLQKIGAEAATVIAAHTVTPADHLLLISSTNRRMIVPIARVLRPTRSLSRYEIPELRLAESIVTALVIPGT